MNDTSALQKAALQEQSPGTGHTLVPSRQPYMSEPFASRRVCFYKSGDAQFSGLPVVINNRTFKTFEALLDNLSKRVPLPFGVRTITTPRGQTAVRSLAQLHHGHSYICSDKRTVKPIDLEQARRKPPPWYHASPVSNRRLRERRSPGPRNTRRKEHAALLHTPKRLVVFRNGDPEVKHTFLLQKRTTHSFEALLDHISEVMCFPVRRLHTPDGRRVDGLPALILCLGVLVAAGREPFRKGNYDVQKPFAPTWLPAKSVGRLHPVTRKKKSVTSSTKSRPFSPSSERYIVNQLHNGFAESAYDPTGSVEMETGQLLDSVAGTDTVTCMDGDTNEYICMPTDDDIEKSFRVNQDGSMTVEMKVRLTIKEEETVHWTTTLSRQSVTSQMKCGLDSYSDLGVALADKIASDVDTDASAIQRCPEEYSNVSTNECLQALYKEMMEGRAEESIRIKETLQPLQEQKQISVETESHDTVQRLDTSREKASSEQEHHLVRQCNKRPVPKPRSTGTSQLQASSYKSAENLQIQDSGQETVLHIYEQQICQKSFLANTQFYDQGICTCDTVLSAPLDMVPSSSKDFDSEPRPATVYRSLQRQETFFPSLALQTSCEQNNPPEIKNKKSKMHTPLTESFKTSAPRMISIADTSKKRKKVRVIVKKSHIFHIANHEYRRNDNKIDILKEIKKIRAAIFNQAGVLRGVTEQYRAKSVKKLLKGKRTNLPISHKSVSSTLHKTFHMQIQSPNEFSAKDHCTNDKNPATADIYQGKLSESFTSQNKHLLNVSTNKCTLTRQTSMQEEQETEEQETQEFKESNSIPTVHYSSPVLNEHVELWLQKSETEPPPDQEQVPPPKSSQELKITCETPGARLASKKNLTPPIPLDSSPRNMPNLSRKEQFSSSSKRIILPRGSAQESSSLSQINTLKGDTKSSQSNSSVNMPLPMTLPLRNNHWKRMSSEDNSSPNENSFSKSAHNVSQENTQLSRNMSLNDAQMTSYTIIDNNLATCENLSSKQEIKQLPHYVKKDNNTDESLGNAFGCANNHVKPTSLTRDPSSEKTLSSQHSIDQIPKNNTLSKASLFSNQRVEKTGLSMNATFYKKPGHSGMIKVSKSTITQGLVGSCENDKCRSLSPLSEKEMPVFPTEKSYTVKMAVRPDMRHILDELCHSINSLREAAQHKQRSCLEKSNSMPDFSSHLASTFGSSSRVLLAFLSVMTLRDGLKNLNAFCQGENSLSCSEALLMLQSLKEVAAIEDAEQLRASLNALQKSASNQLLQSWKGFQQLSNTSISSSITPEWGGSYSVSSSEEEVIQGLMEELGVPDRVREELAALHTQEKESVRGNQGERLEELCESLPEKKVNRYTESGLREETIRFPDRVFEDINTYVKFVLEKAVYAHSNSEVFMANSLLGTEKEIKVVTHEQERNSCPTERIQQADYVLRSNICENILEEEQQRTEEKDIRHKGKQEIYSKQEINMKEIKDRAVCEQSRVTQGRIISKDDSVEEDYIMETDPKYSPPLNSNEELEESKDLMDASEMDNGRITEVDHKSSESSKSKEGLTTSEEAKSSLEEDSCEEEHMNFSEDQVSDKEHLQINLASGLQQKYSMIEPQAKWQSEGMVSQAHMQLSSKTESVKNNTGQPEMQTTLLAVCLEHETGQQTEKIYSEEQQVVVEVPECYTVQQENIDNQKECSPKEAVVCEIKTAQAKNKHSSIAELISNLETCAQRPSSKPGKSVHRFVDHTEVSDPGNVNNISLTGKLTDTTSQSHSSSLAFSYDSQSSSLAQESERSVQATRVKFIRDMFLAKSQTRTQNGQRHVHSPNSDLSDSQQESTDSGGNWSQETSSGEDDASRLAIAKGFVRRTIERLYGRGNSSSVGADNIRSPSALNAKQREGPGRANVSSLASYHEARTRVMTDLSYFSATNASDIFNAPTDCITLNEQVGSGDANLSDTGNWSLAEKQICESSPELQEGHRKGKNNKTISVDREQHSGQEDSLHGTLPSTKLEKWPGSSGSKFTYFNLPNASDSDLEPEEKREVKVAPATQIHKTMAERNSFLPAFSPPVLKKADNKVHPLTEATIPTVVTQPVKGQTAQIGVIKQSAEPDALDALFVFCGQHCPIL
ncbi:oxygen-regulated protein 1 [Pangasianodon hypophthalmus]|uniref:oxygen-regulated protein 1 n=1 Tax=Pangasianodon hypophthalmus TaxID=310915 RepID=UPI002307E27E|nr:oxygen-regulated protein 1 [Pangasianodon hypophthalmus]